MARSIVLGNGHFLVGLDKHGLVRDFYFPHAGHANHVSGASGSYVHRIGVWENGQHSWVDNGEWTISIPIPTAEGRCEVVLHNEKMGLTLHIDNVVHNERNVFLRQVHVRNAREHEREVRVFFGQEFRISESRRGDTAFYDPRVHSLIHYKGHNVFLMHARYNERGFDDYTVGLFDTEGRQGSFADAEDGTLSKNAVEHGSVDSVMGIHMKLPAYGESHFFYWVVAANSIAEAHKLHGEVLAETPERLVASTERYWSAWSERSTVPLTAIGAPLRELYRHSLSVIAHHADHGGGLIASSDTEILNQGRDTYGYVWPRDGAFVALALSRAGYREFAERFFLFVAKLLEPSGYLMHKYRVDGALGSSWHPWVRNGMMELPIQEDETAVILYALGEHYTLFPDIAFIESLYNPFIEPAAEFISGYLDPTTGLPQGSYDLWEEKYGISTYTAASVFAALTTASTFANLLGKRDAALRYRAKAEQVAEAIEKELYDPLSGMYVKLVRRERGGNMVVDRVPDMSSPHGVFLFGVVDPHHVRAGRAFKETIASLLVPGDTGGYMRYKDDNYYRLSKEDPPNPWCITTLWVAQQYIRTARSRDELEKAYAILEWVKDHASESGMLPEQLNPHTGGHLSTSPLLWSHAEFVSTVYFYQKKYRSLPH